MKNKSNIYTINDTPALYAEAATASELETQNPQLNQEHPHTAVYPLPPPPYSSNPPPYSPNYAHQDLDSATTQPSHAQCGSEQQQDVYNGILITEIKNKSFIRMYKVLWTLFTLISIAAVIVIIVKKLT